MQSNAEGSKDSCYPNTSTRNQRILVIRYLFKQCFELFSREFYFFQVHLCLSLSLFLSLVVGLSFDEEKHLAAPTWKPASNTAKQAGANLRLTRNEDDTETPSGGVAYTQKKQHVFKAK